mgnify:CR=1 FL=1
MRAALSRWSRRRSRRCPARESAAAEAAATSSRQDYPRVIRRTPSADAINASDASVGKNPVSTTPAS